MFHPVGVKDANGVLHLSPGCNPGQKRQIGIFQRTPTGCHIFKLLLSGSKAADKPAGKDDSDPDPDSD